ncbi:MAG: hypothetical protein LUH14_08655 [Clostridiaceae bacterium]|nr:hypothetical protein [Clostridiaceae bacterium]
MKGGYKSLIKRRMAVGLIVVLVCGMLPVPGKTVQAASAISMTAFYNDGAYGIGYLEAKAGKQVTISSKEEMEMFFACLKEEERTSGISFLQTEDITFGEYEFVYDEESERIGIYADNALAAAVSEEGEFYKTYTGSTQSSVEKCGLTESYLYRSIDEPDIFYGTYDGGGYSISGLIFQSETSYTSGIFGQIKQGAVVSNLTVKNCLLAKAYGGIMGMNEGTVDNCVADSLTGICDAIGGIAECNSGQISNCRTIHSELIVAGSGDNRLGGITAGNYNGIIESCQTKDTILRSDEEIDAMVGGIAGCQRFETLAQSGIFDCISAAELVGGKYMGGVAGYVYSTGITPQITNCINMGEIYTAKNTISLGGIVGSAADGSSLSVENCGNYGKIVYDENAVTSSANIGGIAGTADGTLTVTDCVNHGEICASDESNPDTAAMFCIGGLVGYSTGELQIVNSANYGLVAEVHSGITKISGGIAGYLGNVSETAVYNCYNIGQVSGTYAGGLIGCGMAADSGTLLTVAENSYNYGEVYGETAGALFGMTSALICSHGYWRDGAAQNMIAGEKSDNITDDVWENCYSLSAEEMASLDTVLNDWVGEQNGDSVYSEWGQEGNGYPEFVYSTQEEMYLAGETEEPQSGETSAADT